VNDEKVKDKITEEDKKAVTDKADELTAWMGQNPNADASE